MSDRRIVAAIIVFCGMAPFVLSGCETEQEERALHVETNRSLRVMLEEREVVAGWFGVNASDVSFMKSPPSAIPGGDRDWKVIVQGSDGEPYEVECITAGGLPSYISRLPVPEIQHTPQEPSDEVLADETEAVEMMRQAVGTLLGVPTISERYIELVEVREHEEARAWTVIVRMIKWPWRDIGEVRGIVRPDLRAIDDLTLKQSAGAELFDHD